MKRNIIIAVVVAAGLTAGYYFLLRPALKKRQDSTPSTGGSIDTASGEAPPSDTPIQKELNELNKSFKNSVRFKDSLKIPFFRNFYILMYDNGRFFIGSNPKGLYQQNKGNWKKKGTLLITDDGRALNEKTVQDNLNIIKTWILSSTVLKDLDEYQELVKKIPKGSPEFVVKTAQDNILKALREKYS